MQITPAANLNPIAPAAPSAAGGATPAENSPFAKMLNAQKAPAKPEAKPAADRRDTQPKADRETPGVDDGSAPEASKKPQAGRRGPARIDLREHAAREKPTAEAGTEPVAFAKDKAEAAPL